MRLPQFTLRELAVFLCINAVWFAIARSLSRPENFPNQLVSKYELETLLATHDVQALEYYLDHQETVVQLRPKLDDTASGDPVRVAFDDANKELNGILPNPSVLRIGHAKGDATWLTLLGCIIIGASAIVYAMTKSRDVTIASTGEREPGDAAIRNLSARSR